jgi:hypothetical protein
LYEIACGCAATNENNNCHKKGFLGHLFHWSDITVPQYLSQGAKSNQDHLLTTAVQKFSRSNTNTGPRNVNLSVSFFSSLLTSSEFSEKSGDQNGRRYRVL